MARKPKPPFKRVELAWADAYSVDGWTPVAELQAMIDKAPEYDDHATGYVVAENERWVAISNAVTHDPEGAGWRGAATMVIPKGMVLRGKRGERRGNGK